MNAGLVLVHIRSVVVGEVVGKLWGIEGKSNIKTHIILSRDFVTG